VAFLRQNHSSRDTDTTIILTYIYLYLYLFIHYTFVYVYFCRMQLPKSPLYLLLGPKIVYVFRPCRV